MDFCSFFIRLLCRIPPARGVFCGLTLQIAYYAAYLPPTKIMWVFFFKRAPSRFFTRSLWLDRVIHYDSERARQQTQHRTFTTSHHTPVFARRVFSLMDPINERMGVGAAEAAAEEPIEPPAPDPPLASPLALVVGQQFDTFQDFKAALSKWAVSQRFGFRFEKSDRLRNVVRDNEFVAVLCLLARALRIIVYYSVKP
jgi:hypothetical protein